MKKNLCFVFEADVIAEPTSKELMDANQEMKELYDAESDSDSDEYDDSDKLGESDEADSMGYLSDDFESNDASVYFEDSAYYEDASEQASNLINIRKQYEQDMRNFKLLSIDEERKLGKAILSARFAREQLDNLKGNETEDEIRSLKALVSAGKEACDRLVVANLRLAYKMAGSFYRLHTGLDKLDLTQAANEGLIVAAERYDVSMGFRFTTYATWWIRQSISRFIDKTESTMKVPIHKQELLRKIKRYSAEVLLETGAKPTEQELAEHFDINLEKLRSLLYIKADTVSLDLTIDEEESTFLMDMIADENSVMPETECMNNALKEDVSRVLDALTDKEKTVLKYRFNLMGEEKKTLEQIGKEFGVTRERVRQLESEAINHIRKTPWMRRTLEQYCRDGN